MAAVFFQSAAFFQSAEVSLSAVSLSSVSLSVVCMPVVSAQVACMPVVSVRVVYMPAACMAAALCFCFPPFDCCVYLMMCKCKNNF